MHDDFDLEPHDDDPLEIAEVHEWGRAEIQRLEGEHAAAIADRDKRLAKLQRQIERVAIQSATRAALVGKVEPKFLKAAMALFIESTPLKVEIVAGAPVIEALTPFGHCSVEHRCELFGVRLGRAIPAEGGNAFGRVGERD